MNRILTIIDKEWAELFKNRVLVFTLLFLPLFFTALPLITLYSTGNVAADDLTGSLPPEIYNHCPAGLSTGQCTQVMLVNQFLLLFMMLPLIIPVNIASFSVVGEKNNHTLEPLLATPVSTAELLIGKNLAAVIPAVLATWFGFLIFLIGSRFIVSDAVVLQAFHDPMWLLAVFLVGPLLAIMAVNFAILVSSRVNDVRVAEQLSSLVILPMVLLFVGQVIGFIALKSSFVVWIALAVFCLDIVLVFFTVEWFEREKILTRWS